MHPEDIANNFRWIRVSARFHTVEAVLDMASGKLEVGGIVSTIQLSQLNLDTSNMDMISCASSNHVK